VPSDKLTTTCSAANRSLCRLGPIFFHIAALLALLATGVVASEGQTAAGLQITGPTPWIDVKAFGATGNGSTDDSTAIQNAINSCPTYPPNAGCTVFFPLGSYKINNAALVISTSQPGVVNSAGLTGNLASTAVYSNAPAGQYQLSVYANATQACTAGSTGSFTPKITYTDSQGSATKSVFTNFTFFGALPDNDSGIITFRQNSTQTLDVSGTYAACGAGDGTGIVDVHFALMRLQ